MAYNKGILKLQETKKKETISEVQQTIEFLQKIEGSTTPITAKKILENSSLSRAVLYKEHVLKIWNPSLWETKYNLNTSNSISLTQHNETKTQLLEQYQMLKKDFDIQQKNNNRIKTALEKATKKIEFYKIELEDITEQNQKLLNECQRLQDKLNMFGIEG